LFAETLKYTELTLTAETFIGLVKKVQ